MLPVITAFRDSPDQGRGLARDLRVRWAFAEVAQPYDVRLLSFADIKKPAHCAVHPFGQIPTFEADGAALFESGAIVLALAERHAGLLPAELGARGRAISWIFSAVGTLEPVIFEREMAGHAEREANWYADRLPILNERIRARLSDLSAYLAERDWLESEFSAGDLMVIDVLRRLRGSGLLEAVPNLARYVARGEDRPAFVEAFAAQHAVYLASMARGA